MSSIVYKKNRLNKIGSGPRDMQLKALSRSGKDADSKDEIIKELTAQLKIYREMISEPAHNGGQTTEDILDDEFNKAVAEATKQEINKVVTEYEQKVKELEFKVASLEAIVASKDELIATLKEHKPVVVQTSVDSTSPVVDNSRPSIDSVVVDPTSSGDLESLEDHIDVNDTSIASTNRDKVNDKVNKLKNLVGKI